MDRGQKVTIGLFALMAVAFTVGAILARHEVGAAIAIGLVAVFCVAIAGGYAIVWHRRADLERHGVAGVAWIESHRDTGISINRAILCRVTLRVHPEGGEPYLVRRLTLVPRTAVGVLTGGRRVGVVIDRRDPQRVAVAW